MKIRKYRIITDNYAGHECQCKRIWFPVRLQIDSCNTFSIIEDAIKFIESYKTKIENKKNIRKVVWSE